MLQLTETKMVSALGTYLGRSEPKDFWRILGFVWERRNATTKEILDALCMGPPHGQHHVRLMKQLQRMREVGVLEFWRGDLKGAHFHHRVSELGAVLQVALAESKE